MAVYRSSGSDDPGDNAAGSVCLVLEPWWDTGSSPEGESDRESATGRRENQSHIDPVKGQGNPAREGLQEGPSLFGRRGRP